MKTKVHTFLQTIKRDWLHSASGTGYCLGNNIPLRAFGLAVLTSEFQVVFLYRIYSVVYQLGLRVIAVLLYLAVKFFYKCDIHPKCRIGRGFLLVHGFDVVIGPDVLIGEDVVVFNGVNMGKKHVGQIHALMPIIGDRCIIGAGAKILGGISLGDDVKVGANSVVLKDVPSGATCVGVPAKIIKGDMSQ